MIQTIKMISSKNRIKLLKISLIAIVEAVLGSVPFILLYLILCDIIDNRLTADNFYSYVIIISAITVIRISFFIFKCNCIT